MSGYEPILEYARGGMGTVFLCRRREGRFERLYALKRLHAHVKHDPGLAESFVEEGRIAGAIRHAHVVSVLDVGSDDAGPFLVMDFVDGLSLAQMLGELHGAGELVPPGIALEIVRQAALGLHAAHELRASDGTPLELVHRDVTPHNILVGYDGIARVTDFGIAKALDTGSETATGILKGKVGYMSPEQLSFRAIDRRSDLFSLGVVLFELLTGRRLYKHPSEILRGPPPDLGDERSGLPPELTELLFDLLSKFPGHRPASAREVASRIQELMPAVAAEPKDADLAMYLQERFERARADATARIEAALRTSAGDAARPVPRKRSRRALSVAIAAAVIGAAGVALAIVAPWSSAPATPRVHRAATPPAVDVRAAAAPAPPLPSPAPSADEVTPEAEVGAESAPSSQRSVARRGGGRARRASAKRESTEPVAREPVAREPVAREPVAPEPAAPAAEAAPRRHRVPVWTDLPGSR